MWATCWRFKVKRGRANGCHSLERRNLRDATQRLGDRGDRLVAVAMHSATEAALRKLDLIDFIPDSQGETQIKDVPRPARHRGRWLSFPCGHDDGLVYTTYLFGLGSFGMGFADLNGAPWRRSRHRRLRNGA